MFSYNLIAYISSLQMVTHYFFVCLANEFTIQMYASQITKSTSHYFIYSILNWRFFLW